MNFQYQDKWIRIIAYPVLGFIIRHFGEMGLIGHLLKTPIYYFDVLWDILIVAVAWEANKKLIQYYDKHYPWQTRTAFRVMLQPLTALPMSFALVVPMVYVYNELLTDHGNFDTANLLVMDLPLTIVFTVMVHMLYTGMYYQHYFTQKILTLESRIKELESISVNVRQGDIAAHRNVLVANHGTASVPVKTDNIAYIYKQNEVSFIRTFDAREFTSTSSLDSLESLIDPKDFFRINRQILASQKSIKQFKTDPSGKLVLEVTPSFSQETTISRKKASEFKAWMGV